MNFEPEVDGGRVCTGTSVKHFMTRQRHIIWRFRINGGSLNGKEGIGVKYEPADLEEALARMHSMHQVRRSIKSGHARECS